MKKKILGIVFAAVLCTTPAILLSACTDNHGALETWETTSTHHWHNCKDEKCDDIFDYAEHSGGTASCTQLAQCSVCGESYGELAGHQTQTILAKAPSIIEEGYTLHQKCDNCDYTEGYKKIPYLAFKSDANLSKTYDGSYVTSSVVLENIEASEGYNLKVAFFANSTPVLAPKDAGSYKAVVYIEGSEDVQEVFDELNFTISPASITKAEIEKEYWGSNVIESAMISTGVGQEMVELKNITLASKNVNLSNGEAMPVTVSSFALENSNYTLSLDDLKVTILPKDIGEIYQGFTYNGQTSFSSDLGAVDGIIGDDSVKIQAVFESKNVGAKTTSLVLAGQDAGNYTAVLNSNISPKDIGEIYQGFTYNGQTSFSSDLGAVDGIIGDDSVKIQAVFESKNVGAKTTSLVLAGQDAGNYTAVLNSNISPKALNTISFNALWMNLNGERTFSKTLSSADGLLEGDSAKLTVKTASYAMNAPISSIELSEADGGNYTISNENIKIGVSLKLTITSSSDSTKKVSVYVKYGESTIYSNMLCTAVASASTFSSLGEISKICTASGEELIDLTTFKLKANVAQNGTAITDANGAWLIADGKTNSLINFTATIVEAE